MVAIAQNLFLLTRNCYTSFNRTTGKQYAFIMTQLQKARLVPVDPVSPIEFMFNPTELSFEESVETADNPGARTQTSGKPKVSFSNIKPSKVTITNIIFDTYEDGTDVVGKYIAPFKQAVKFVPGLERPPLYTFTWGQVYLRRCFVESLNYKLTMFMPSGTPVRARIDTLTLKEADEPTPGGSLAATVSQAMRVASSL